MKFLSRSALLAVIATIVACVAAASASAAPLVIAGNYGADSVSVINSQTNQILGEVEVGKGPYSVAITPDGSYAYVANETAGTVSVVNIATRQVVGEPIKVGAKPSTIAFSPNGADAYVTDHGSSEVSVIEAATKKVVAEIPVGTEPYGIAVSPGGNFAYVTIEETDSVEVIDTHTDKVVGGPIAVGPDPVSVAFTPDGKTAYVADDEAEEISAIDTETRGVTSIKVGYEPWGVAVTPDGSKAFVSDYGSDSISVVNLATKQAVLEFPVGKYPYELAITPDGKTMYVAEYGAEDIRAYNTQTYAEVGAPINLEGLGPWQVAITPDQSPVAAFTAPEATATLPTTFSGAASTDKDGTISAYNWVFGDGTTGTGITPSHTYAAAGTYTAKLSVVDNEGCGEAEVFTGRTAYCSGGASSVTHTVTVNPTSNNFKFGRLVHNRKNGTAKLQVKLPAAGSVLLLGGKVHAVSKKATVPTSMWLVIHPRVEVNKRLKKVHHIKVTVRVKFSPTGGTPKTKTRSFQLLRAPGKKHR